MTRGDSVTFWRYPNKGRPKKGALPEIHTGTYYKCRGGTLLLIEVSASWMLWVKRNRVIHVVAAIG